MAFFISNGVRILKVKEGGVQKVSNIGKIWVYLSVSERNFKNKKCEYGLKTQYSHLVKSGAESQGFSDNPTFPLKTAQIRIKLNLH